MKKHLGNLLLFITSFMCVIVLFVCVSINSRAEKATLFKGLEFTNALRELAGSNIIPNGNINDVIPEYNIEKIVFLSKASKTKVSTFPSKSVGKGVTAYYDKSSKTVYIKSSSTIYFNSDSPCMFKDFAALQSIKWSNELNTTNITNMRYMFSGCKSLKNIDVSIFNCSNVTSMSEAFSNCQSLESIDFSKAKIVVTYRMSDLFKNCTNLKSVNLKGINSSNAKEMGDIFSECSSLEYVDISPLDFSNATYIVGFFYRCKSLKSINLGTLYAPNVKSLQYMFTGCESLEKIDLTKIKVPNLTDTFIMFQECKSLTELDFSSWDMSKVTQPDGMVNFCTSLKKLNMSKVNLKVPDFTKYKFQGENDILHYNPSLEEIDISGIDFSNIDGKSLDYRLAILSKTLRIVISPTNLKDDIPCTGYGVKECIFALDDNADNIPDNDKRFNMYLPASKVSHRYIVVHESAPAPQPDPQEPDPQEPDTPSDPPSQEEPDKPSDSPSQEVPKTPTVNVPESTAPANSEKTEIIDPNQKTTKIKELKAGKKKVTITWKKIKNIKGYEIQYSTDKNFQKNVKSVTVNKAKTTSKTIKKLKSHTKYYFRIRTFRKNGTDKIYSKWSKTKNVRLLILAH